MRVHPERALVGGLALLGAIGCLPPKVPPPPTTTTTITTITTTTSTTSITSTTGLSTTTSEPPTSTTTSTTTTTADVSTTTELPTSTTTTTTVPTSTTTTEPSTTTTDVSTTTTAPTSTTTTTTTVYALPHADPPPTEIWEPYRGDPAGRKVAVIGDSISSLNPKPNGNIAGNYYELHAALEPDHLVSIDGQGGTFLQYQMPWADLYAATNPDVVIIALGTNDLSILWWDLANGHPFGRSLEQVEAEHLAMTAKFPSSCVVVMNMSTSTGVAAFNAVAEPFNAWLAEHYTRIVDWHSVAMHTFDGVHPDATGKALLTELERAQVATC